MLLQNAPQNEAILSNVGEIGDFKIKASAKAFNILSSGLYANKVRAIVRELSCNAVDSHVAAGKADTPFEVHLPNTLEPWFSIRDYGTGLSHEQVTNIYTTYFESSKTESNDYIGALGLGSKSPFSYTDNFTVTAIKDGRKGIYSAFINEMGVPSIALMMEEQTTDPAGVEVKFSVNDRWDFDKFFQEARNVYTYFKLRPVISGNNRFEFYDIEYTDRDIVPGIHAQTQSRGYGSYAVMGNISYPIDIPQADASLGSLRTLLQCNLEIHFAIGELDFQASREGLSYIPQTIAAIKSKLELLNNNLAGKLASEADAIKNLWERATFLYRKSDQTLWKAAVEKYVVDTKFPLLLVNSANSYRNVSTKTFKFSEAALASDYNICVRAFSKSRGNKGTSTLKSYQDWKVATPAGSVVPKFWDFVVSDSTHFASNDTKVGGLERVKYHWNNTPISEDDPYSNEIFILEAVDKTKPMNSDQFLKDIMNPSKVALVSTLLQKARVSNSGKNVTIMMLEEKGYGGYYSQKDLVWRDAGKADSFDSSETYYYLPLSGYAIQSIAGAHFDVKNFKQDLKSCGIEGLDIKIYGVRKGDIKFIETQKNWVNIETHISNLLNKVTASDLTNMVVNSIDDFKVLRYNSNIATDIINKKSPFLAVMEKFKDVKKVEFNLTSFNRLCSRYAKVINLDDMKKKFESECFAVYDRYPLVRSIDTYRMNSEAVAEYVNLIDAKKGI